MKRAVVFTLGLFLCFGLFAQSHEETKNVKLPEFNMEENVPEQELLNHQGICCYFQRHLKCPVVSEFETREGTVVVDFVVDVDGSVRDVDIKNSRWKSLNKAIMKCLLSTSGRWSPGSIGSKPMAMAQRFYIRVDVPGNETHEEKAAHYIRRTQELYHKGHLLTISTRQANRYFKRARKQVELAMQYCPKSYDVRLWDRNINRALKDESFFDGYYKGKADPSVYVSEDVLSEGVDFQLTLKTE